jgi:hypothetical protein
MNDEQRADINSYLALREVHQKAAHRALWSSLPAYALLFDRFLAKLSYINACLLIQNTDTSGITLAKKDARTKLTESIFEIAGLLSAYGMLSGNLDLQTRGDLVISDITRLDDKMLDTEGQAFLDLARGLPAPAAGQLTPADTGLTPGKLDLLDTRLETYNLLLGSPRAARGEKTAATANLAAALKEIEAILAQGLDKLVYQFRTTDFYQEYQSARKSINTAVRHDKSEGPTGSSTPDLPPPGI